MAKRDDVWDRLYRAERVLKEMHYRLTETTPLINPVSYENLASDHEGAAKAAREIAKILRRIYKEA